MNQAVIRFTTQHGDFDTGDCPILYVEGLDGGYVAKGQLGEAAEDYADTQCRWDATDSALGIEEAGE
jgi:hypothetical protein